MHGQLRAARQLDHQLFPSVVTDNAEVVIQLFRRSLVCGEELFCHRPASVK